jgi:hypothetical protein
MWGHVMTFKIEHQEVSKLVEELAHMAGETTSEAILAALRERL